MLRIKRDLRNNKIKLPLGKLRPLSIRIGGEGRETLPFNPPSEKGRKQRDIMSKMSPAQRAARDFTICEPHDRAAVADLWRRLKEKVGGEVAYHLMGGCYAPDAGGASLAVAYLALGRGAANEAETDAVWDRPYGFIDIDRRSIEQRLDRARRTGRGMRSAERALAAHRRLFEMLMDFYPREEEAK